jgi:hypothetical protein
VYNGKYKKRCGLISNIKNREIMQNKIIHFKTGEEVSNDFYTLLANVSSCCDSDLQLIKNERSDASYQYLLWCPKCKKTLCKIDWSDKIIYNVC